MPCSDAHHVCIDQAQAFGGWSSAHGGMFSQCLSNPPIFSLVCADNNDEVVSSSIVGMQEVGDKTKESKATREDNKLILVGEFGVEVLLIFLSLKLDSIAYIPCVECVHTRGNDNLTGGCPLADGIYGCVVTGAGQMKTIEVLYY